MLNQNEINKQLWKICDNFKNKTEIKKNYIVYISMLLYIRFDYTGEYYFNILYNNRNNYYIGDAIDREKERITKNDKDLFSNIRFRDIKIYRDIGEENIIGKTIEDIHNLSYKIPNKKSIAEAYEYILEQSVYRNDIIKELGEFHTPAEIAKVMAKLTINDDYMNVYDPICGSGNLLKSAVEFHKVEIYGRENNLDYYNILKTRFLLNEINSKNIVYGNEPINNNLKTNVILSNPPFADRTWKDNDSLRNITYKYRIPNSAVGDYIYVLNMLDKLDIYGKMAVILPHGVLFRENEKEVRERLIKDNCIEAIIGLPENLFHSTRIPVIIMIISKNRKEESVLFIDASQDYENDRKNNILSKEYQDKIIYTFIEKKEIADYSHLASKEEIINNEFDLTIKKYIQKRKKLEKVDREELTKDVKKLKLEQERLEENIKDVLEVLGYKDIGEVQPKESQIKQKKESLYVDEIQIRNNSGIDYVTIGKRIKEARKRKVMSQEQLAEFMDVSIAYLSRIERGTSQINLKRLTQICDILDVSEGEMLRGKM